MRWISEVLSMTLFEEMFYVQTTYIIDSSGRKGRALRLSSS